MKLTITSIKLRTPFHFFLLSLLAMRVVFQLKQTRGLHRSQTTGFWTKHYTMTLWDGTESLKSFARTGNHLAAMKRSASLASEIRILTIEAEKFPTWKAAKLLLDSDARVIRY